MEAVGAGANSRWQSTKRDGEDKTLVGGSSGVPRGGSGVQTPPRNSEGPPKHRAKLTTRLWKLLKKELLNLGRQHTKMFGKKGSKILKLPRFAIVLH